MIAPHLGEQRSTAGFGSGPELKGGFMSLLARLAPHLPYVRRYARALTGDQTTGDQYVRVALEALAAGERTLDPGMSPRVALYHVFHAIWCTTGAQLEAPVDD